MQLEDCVLSADIVTAAPLVRDSPEEQWIRARYGSDSVLIV
jgi:hypothetical protein